MTKIEFIELINDIGFKRQTFGWSKRIELYNYINITDFEDSINITISKMEKFKIDSIFLFKFNIKNLSRLQFLKLISDYIEVSDLEKKYIRDQKIDSICNYLDYEE
jgi:hypothetical protein